MNKRAISLTLLATMALSGSSIAYASGDNSNNFVADDTYLINMDNVNVEEKVAEAVKSYQDYFLSQGTSVREIMTNEITTINEEMLREVDNDKKEKLGNLIKEYENIIVEYEAYQASLENNYATPYGYPDSVIRAGVDAVISYFTLNDYPLAAELMTYSKNSGGRNYYPVRIDNLFRTSEYNRIKGLCIQAGSGSTSGNARFELGSRTENDAYYAIHGCPYTYSNHNLTFKDLYDFELKPYDGLAGIAIDVLYAAQERGVVQNYYLYITTGI